MSNTDVRKLFFFALYTHKIKTKLYQMSYEIVKTTKTCCLLFDNKNSFEFNYYNYII